MSGKVKHEARKISGNVQGRPGRWVCSCGESKRFTPFTQAAEVAADYRKHRLGKLRSNG